MSLQYPSGLITKTPVTPSGPYETSTASGVWTLDEQAYWQKLGQWPTAGNFPPDPQFNYVTMLLHGDGTNGAQNNTFLDSSANNFTITRNGNTTQGSFSPYGSNWGNYFGTANGNALLFTELTLSSDFTIETWIYPTAQSSSGYTITFSASSSAEQIMYYYTDGSIGCYFANGANGISSTGKLSMNVWSHVAVVRSGSTVKIYVNGVDTGVSISGSSTVTVGTISGYTTGSGYNVYGYLSNVRIGTTAVYTSNFTPPTAPLTAITGTLLLTCQSNRYVDNSASARAITTLGTPSVQRFNPFGTSTAYSTSVIGGSGYFDGTTDYVTAPANSAFSLTGDFCIEGWIYQTRRASDSTVLELNDYQDGILMRLGSGSSFDNLYINNTDYVAPAQYFPLNQFNHYAITRSGTTVRLFSNGVQVWSDTISGTINSVSGALRYGQPLHTSAQNFQGWMSDCRVVKGSAVYTSAFTPPTAPLTAITNTSLLLNYTNGAIFDNAMMNDLETVGNAQISTSVVKYGTGSIALDGTGDYMTFVPGANCALGTGDFTVEGWFYITNNLTDVYFFDTRNASQTSNCWGCGYGQGGTSGRLAFFIGTGFVQTSGSVGSLNTWMHIAFVRASGTLTIYLNGTSVASGSLTDNASTISTLGYIGTRYTQTFDYGGYIDDLRITKGYARYTANFTPPTAAFPNIGPT